MQFSHLIESRNSTVQVFTKRNRINNQPKPAPIVSTKKSPKGDLRQIRMTQSPLDAPSVDVSSAIKIGHHDERFQPVTKAELDDTFDIEVDEIHSIFDDSSYSDCGFIAMAEHTEEMSSLERFISESCYCPRNGGKVTHPRPVLSDGLTKYFRSEYVAKRLQCNATTADRFISDWQRLSLTGSIIETVIRGIQKKDSLASASIYFSRLASQMPDPDLEDEYDTYDRLQNELIYSDDETDEEFLMEQEDREHESVPEGHIFIPVGFDNPEPKSPLGWNYHKAIRELHGTYSYIATKALCSRVMKAKRLSNFETSMFLKLYRDKLKAVKAFWIKQDRKLGTIHKHLLSTGPQNLAIAGSWLARLAVGKETLAGYVPKPEGTKILKDEYFTRKDPKPVKEKFEFPDTDTQFGAINSAFENWYNPQFKESAPIPESVVSPRSTFDCETVPSAFQLDLPEPKAKSNKKRVLPVTQAISHEIKPVTTMVAEPSLDRSKKDTLARRLQQTLLHAQSDVRHMPVARRVMAKLDALPFKFSYDGCPFLATCKKRNRIDPCPSFSC